MFRIFPFLLVFYYYYLLFIRTTRRTRQYLHMIFPLTTLMNKIITFYHLDYLQIKLCAKKELEMGRDHWHQVLKDLVDSRVYF